MTEADDKQSHNDDFCLDSEFRDLLLMMINEMQNPLSNAQGFAHLIKEELGKPEQSEALDLFVDSLKTSVDQLYNLLNAYFECAKQKRVNL